MASIPLPALDIKPPAPQESPLDQYARIAQLQGLAQQRQIQQQQLVGAQQENQVRARQIQDTQTFMDAASAAPKGSTISDILPTLQGKITPQTYQSLTKADLDMKQAAATLTKEQHENFSGALGEVQKIYNNISNLPDDQLAAQTPQIAAQINPWLAKMTIPGQQPKQLDPSQPLTKAQLQQFGPTLGLYEGYLSQEAGKKKTAAETTEATNKAEESAAQTKRIEQETQFGPTGPGAEARYRFVLGKKLAGQEVSPEDLNFAQAYEAANKKTTTQSDSLGISSTNTSGPSGLSSVGKGGGGGAGAPAVPAGSGGASKPASSTGSGAGSAAQNKQSIVDEIGQYKADPTLFSRAIIKHPELISMVQQKYPDWDQTSYNAKNKIVQSYTSGPESKSINAISTALGHAGELGTAIDALNNGDAGLKTLRGLANKLKVEFGGDSVTTFNTIVHRLAPEIAAAYIQGGGGEGERSANAEDFSPSLGGTQLRNNLGATIKLLRSKIAAQEQQWNNTYKPSRPEDAFEQRFLTPQAKDALSKWSPQAGGSQNGGQGGQPLTLTLPSGKTITIH